jgi:hypothetical protein
MLSSLVGPDPKLKRDRLEFQKVSGKMEGGQCSMETALFCVSISSPGTAKGSHPGRFRSEYRVPSSADISAASNDTHLALSWLNQTGQWSRTVAPVNRAPPIPAKRGGLAGPTFAPPDLRRVNKSAVPPCSPSRPASDKELVKTYCKQRNVDQATMATGVELL